MDGKGNIWDHPEFAGCFNWFAIEKDGQGRFFNSEPFPVLDEGVWDEPRCCRSDSHYIEEKFECDDWVNSKRSEWGEIDAVRKKKERSELTISMELVEKYKWLAINSNGDMSFFIEKPWITGRTIDKIWISNKESFYANHQFIELEEDPDRPEGRLFKRIGQKWKLHD